MLTAVDELLAETIFIAGSENNQQGVSCCSLIFAHVMAGGSV